MKKNYLLEYVMHGLTLTLLVGGLGHSIFVSLYFPITLLYTLGMTVTLYIICSVYLWNKWTLITLSPITVLFGWIYTLFLPKNWWEGLIPWFEWMALYPLGFVPLEQEFIYPSAWVVIAILMTVYYVLVVKLRLLTIPLLLGIGVIAIEWSLGHTQITPFIWPFALAMILVLGGKHHQRLSQSPHLPNYGMWQAWTLPLALVVTLTSMAVVPKDTAYLKWGYLEDKIHDISERWTNRFGFTGPRQPFRLSDTGFSSSSDQLGGPVKLSDDVVLEVKAPSPLYLRGTILNEYTGSSWIDSIDDKRYRFSDFYWGHIQDTAFDFDEPIWGDLDKDMLEVFFPSMEVHIDHTGIETSVLFNAQRCKDIVPGKGTSYKPYFNGKGESFTSRYIKKGEPYILKVRAPNLKSQEFLKYLVKYVPVLDPGEPIPEELQFEQGYRQKLFHILEHYTKVPNSIPRRVFELAYTVTENADTPIEKALALQSHLIENYTYTLSPPYTPSDKDFTDYFLFELKKGYCTYFATAMAVMGRIVGLPTRYIEGFSMPGEADDGDVYEVRKRNGHAWVEIYFPKVGWLPFDPTPVDHTNVTQTAGGYTGAGMSYWEEYMEEYMQNQGNNPDINLGLTGQNTGTKTWWQKAMPAILVVTSLILLISLLLGIFVLWYKMRWLGLRKKPLNRQLYGYYNEILWLLALYGCPIKPGETPYAYASRVDNWLINGAGSMRDICQLLVRSHFGSYQLTEQDIKTVIMFYNNLEDTVKRIVGLPGYMIKLIKREIKKRLGNS